MKVGSLFSGVGGFDIAAERAGMEIMWQSENDKHASEVLAEHWPDITNYGDIHDITIGQGGDAGSHAARVDVLVGGFPCQDYSVAGLRDGLAGDRGALWWEFHRLIDEGRPRWVVGENVPGLLSSRGGAEFAIIIDSLTELGYRVAWRVLDAQYFGVAQRRRRVFIVAHSGDKSPSQVLALAEGLSGYPQPSRETGQGIAGTLETRPTDSRQRVEENHVIPFAQNTRDEVRIVDEDNGAQISGALAAEPGMKQQTYIMRQREGKPGGRKGPLLSEDRSLTLAANTNDQVLFVNGRQDPDVRDGISGPLDTELNTSVVAYDELNDTLADTHHTQRAGTKQSTGVISNMQVRRLTPLECTRLQGFPDGWVANSSDTQAYRQMGNAVAVPVAEWVMRRIAKEDDR